MAGFPTDTAAQQAQHDADFQWAVIAYRFWYPTVSVEGIFAGNRDAGIGDNPAIGIAACGPRQVGFTLNSDPPYGSATLDVSDGPVVIELPSGPFIGLVNDHHQGWVVDMGIPGPDEDGEHVFSSSWQILEPYGCATLIGSVQPVDRVRGESGWRGRTLSCRSCR